MAGNHPLPSRPRSPYRRQRLGPYYRYLRLIRLLPRRIVAYSNEAKASLLGVSEETLATRGAVSAECAREMAEGARRAFGADLAVATTGIAGPGGATERKPAGLVYIALAGPNGATTEEFRFPGGRAVVTDASTEAALLMLLRGLERRLGKG